MSRFFAAAALAVVTLLPSAAFSQHHHHHHHTHVHSSSSGGYWGHPHWTHVSPAHSYYGHHHHGTYYVDAGRYYYVPTQVTYVTTAGYSPPPMPPQAPVQLSFGGFAYSNDLTGRFEADANLFCLDLYYNYSQNPGFAETYRGAYVVLQAAKDILNADQHGDRAEIARRVSEIDRQFHQVQLDVARFQRQQHRQIGNGTIMTKSQAMEAVLHHLAYTVGVELHSGQPGYGPGGREEAPPPPDAAAPPLKSPALP